MSSKKKADTHSSHPAQSRSQPKATTTIARPLPRHHLHPCRARWRRKRSRSTCGYTLQQRGTLCTGRGSTAWRSMRRTGISRTSFCRRPVMRARICTAARWRIARDLCLRSLRPLLTPSVRIGWAYGSARGRRTKVCDSRSSSRSFLFSPSCVTF